MTPPISRKPIAATIVLGMLAFGGTVILAPEPAYAEGKLVSSKVIRTKGYVLRIKNYGKVVLRGIAPKGDPNAECMVDVTSVQNVIEEQISAGTFGATSIEILYRGKDSNGVVTCSGAGTGCTITVDG